MTPSQLIWVAWDHPDAVALREQMIAEVSALYVADRGSSGSANHRDGHLALDPATIVATGLIYDGDTPVAHVALRRLGDDLEIKRMFVVPGTRGLGVSRNLLDGVEQKVREAGARRVILHTGTHQHAAIALYMAHGFTEIPIYPPYVGLPDSLCFEKLFVDDRPG
ncbi:MAG: GNAT family N-acetyltransferase [Aeromicrobium sp.]